MMEGPLLDHHNRSEVNHNFAPALQTRAPHHGTNDEQACGTSLWLSTAACARTINDIVGVDQTSFELIHRRSSQRQY